MWSIIRRNDDGNYDLVPNSWVQSENECLYPNAGLGQIKKSARNNEPPQKNWETVTIQIKKRNIDDFDRGMIDVIRFTHGNRSISSSEAEEKGRGRRKIIKRKMFDEEKESGEELSNDEPDHFLDIGPSEPKCRRTSVEVESYLPPFPALVASSPLAPNKQKPPLAKCKVAKNKKHMCAFNDNEANVTTNAHVLCHLSKSLYSLHGNVGYLKEVLDDISEKLDKLGSSNKPSQENENDDILNTLDGFPIKSSEDLLEMENKLKDREFFTRSVRALSACAEKTSTSRTVTSIMKKIVSREIASYYTWKGLKRKDHKQEKKAFKDLYLAKLLFGAAAKCIKTEELDLSKIATVAANWLAQSAVKHEKLDQQEPGVPACRNQTP